MVHVQIKFHCLNSVRSSSEYQILIKFRIELNNSPNLILWQQAFKTWIIPIGFSTGDLNWWNAQFTVKKYSVYLVKQSPRYSLIIWAGESITLASSKLDFFQLKLFLNIWTENCTKELLASLIKPFTRTVICAWNKAQISKFQLTYCFFNCWSKFWVYSFCKLCLSFPHVSQYCLQVHYDAIG